MNSFEAHGIDHLSASSCNTFAAAPALWVAERLLGRKSPVGAGAHRGTAVEAGVTQGLLDFSADLEECVATAEARYRELTVLSGDPKRDAEGEAVAPLVRQALTELRSYGVNPRCQELIEWSADGLAVPFRGYIDFYWPYHGILTDLKTQLRLASEIKTPHARQVASYAGQLGNNIDARVTYVTPRKVATYRLENVRQHIECLVKIGLTIQRFLAVSKDPQELAGLLVPDIDSFYFNDPQTRQTAWEIWGV